jgi:hypothetical protein
LTFQFLRTDRRAWSALLVLFLLSLPAVTTRIYASDEVEYFSYLRSLWFDHDVRFENEYQHFWDAGLSRAAGFHETFLERRTATGRRENWGTLGCAILWSPFYAAADVWARLARASGRPMNADGFSPPYVAAVCYGSAVYGFLALVLSAAAARKALGAPPALPGTAHAPSSGGEAMAAAAVWVGTPLLFYVYVSPPFSHACSAFAVAAFVLAWLHVRETWSAKGVIGLGVLAALMTMVREQDAFFAVGPALDFVWTAAGTAGRRVVRGERGTTGGAGRDLAALSGRAALGVAASAIAFVPQALAYLALNGRIGPSRVVSAKMYWWAPHALQVLCSTEHGLFFWTPLALVALAGVAWRLRRSADARQTAAVLLLMFATQVYISGSVESWTAAGGFGHRRFVGTTVLLVIGMCTLVRAARSARARAGLGTVVALCVWWNVALIVQFGTGEMDRQRLNLPQNARATFVDVPIRAPRLAWRYLFDRASFYARPGGQPR